MTAILNRMLGLAAIAGVCLAGAAPAFADIKVYNTAVMRGDFAAASNEAEAIWASYDKSQQDTAIIAREFAWTSMLAGRTDRARAYARWLVDEGARLPTPDDDPLMSKLLLIWADLGKEPKPEARKALSEALNAWADTTRTSSRIAVRAATELYAREWNLTDWEGARRDAMLASRIAARLGAEGIAIEERAKVDAAAAQFLDTKKIESWFELADAHDALMVRMGPPKPGENVADLDLVDARAHAWLEAMGAYFRFGERSLSSGITWTNQYRRLEERKKTLKSRCGDVDCDMLQAGGATARCAAAWDQKPAIRYPSLAAFRGLVGATVLDLTTDEAGAVTDVKVLAAVPSEPFPEAALKAVRQWKLKKNTEAAEPCTLAGKRRLTAVFQMM